MEDPQELTPLFEIFWTQVFCYELFADDYCPQTTDGKWFTRGQ
jgi:hypothetical protein